MTIRNGFFAIILMTVCGAPHNVFALAWNDPGITPVQRISDHRWIDANTGRLINVTGMPNVTPPTPTPPTPTPAPPGPGGTGGGTTTPAKGWKGMSGAQRAMGVLGAAAGAYGIYESTSGQGEHGAMNVVGGAASGAIMGASIGSMVPVIGTAIGAVGGAIIGGLISGSQIFSETDCLQDPVTGKYTCCNTVFNKGERQVSIGGYMFCADTNLTPMPPGVRQCLQGGDDHDHGWWGSIWKDDEWEKECKPKWCDGFSEPQSGTPAASIAWFGDPEKICWAWDCAEGYTKTGNTCVQNENHADQPDTSQQPVTPATPQENPYDKMIEKVQQLRQQMQEDCSGII